MATPRVDIIRKFQGDRSQNEYARFLGVSVTTLSRVLSGERGADFVLTRLMGKFPEHASEIAAALATDSTAPAPRPVAAGEVAS